MQKWSKQVFLYLWQSNNAWSSFENYSVVKSCYHAYLGIRIGDQDKSFAPHICCRTCTESFRRWSKDKTKPLPFGVPMVWREGMDYVTDCYFCMTQPTLWNPERLALTFYFCENYSVSIRRTSIILCILIPHLSESQYLMCPRI